ncbi:carboxylesterase family protein [Pedobacter cryotolerans]|uniref:Phospholipase n=1 Tax=Pedobacter cryotolerans TaxID=2571270 RepID=A0A4U1C2K5_9SPHI|nr:dienelactone hydrolase family protein [Pedobacter cryotolerans]TKB99366.1 phospholipase [Pedobacter cryotolerans]
MSHYFKGLTLLIFFINISVFCNAQTQIFDSLTVDSTTFVNTKNKINQLSIESFKKQKFTQQQVELPYRLLLPKNYNQSQKYPLVITFHNSSRIGNDNEKQLEPLAKIWLRPEIYDNFPCFVIAPQFNKRSSNYTKQADGILSSIPSDDVNLVLKLIDSVSLKYGNIDKSRIYLVGYSMGASTAQNLMTIDAKKFAAIVSIAAVPDLSNLRAFKNKNMLLIHGQNDTENPYNGSVELAKKLKNNKKLIFKTYINLNHDNINIPFLLSDEIPKWLFKQKNKT